MAEIPGAQSEWQQQKIHPVVGTLSLPCAWHSPHCVGRCTDGGVVNGFNGLMSDALPLFPLPYATLPGESEIQRSQAAPWWSGPSTQERHHVLLGALGAALILGMLLVFAQVVTGAVEQGAARRAATAVQLASDAACTAMRGPRALDACRAYAAATGTTTLTASR